MLSAPSWRTFRKRQFGELNLVALVSDASSILEQSSDHGIYPMATDLHVCATTTAQAVGVSSISDILFVIDNLGASGVGISLDIVRQP